MMQSGVKNELKNCSTELKNSLEESNEEINSSSKKQSWSSTYSYISKCYIYCILKYLDDNCTDKLILKNEGSMMFSLDNNKQVSIMTYGLVVYSINEKLISVDVGGDWITVSSGKNISDLIFKLNTAISNKNPFIGKNLLFSNDNRSPSIDFMKVKKIKLEEVILEENIKDDIIDNTIFHLNELEGSNGIILHGDPGVGKSLVCTAIALEANKHKISTITVASNPDFTFLKEFSERFLKKCIIFLEDIDSIGEDREKTTNSKISELLQFLNGIGTMKSDMVFVATTNYLEYLDNALKNRPVRFNRIIKLNLPNEKLLNSLFSTYIGKKHEKIYSSYCSRNGELKLTGAHIKEISRTAKMISKRKNKEIEEVLQESIETVLKSFNTTIKSALGFSKN